MERYELGDSLDLAMNQILKAGGVPVFKRNGEPLLDKDGNIVRRALPARFLMAVVRRLALVELENRVRFANGR